MKTENILLLIIMLLGAVCLLAGRGNAAVVDFGDRPVGMVVAGIAADGSTVSDMMYPDFTLQVDNGGDGPDSLVVCDAGRFTANHGLIGDGHGGGPYVMVVADDVNDAHPADGLVDTPSYATAGGVVDFRFRTPVNLSYVLLKQFDGRPFAYRIQVDGHEPPDDPATGEWTGPGTFVGLGGDELSTRLTVLLSGGGGIWRLGYVQGPIPVRSTAWGAVKTRYR